MLQINYNYIKKIFAKINVCKKTYYVKKNIYNPSFQLFPIKNLKSFKDDHIFFMCEDYGLCTYEKHHKHKIFAFFICNEILCG